MFLMFTYSYAKEKLEMSRKVSLKIVIVLYFIVIVEYYEIFEKMYQAHTLC